MRMARGRSQTLTPSRRAAQVDEARAAVAGEGETFGFVAVPEFLFRGGSERREEVRGGGLAGDGVGLSCSRACW